MGSQTRLFDQTARLQQHVGHQQILAVFFDDRNHAIGQGTNVGFGGNSFVLGRSICQDFTARSMTGLGLDRNDIVGVHKPVGLARNLSDQFVAIGLAVPVGLVQANDGSFFHLA